MKMNNQPFDFWPNIFELGKVLAPWGTVGVVMYNAINKLFKYFSDSRDAELRGIVEEEMKPYQLALDKQSKLIGEMTVLIGVLNNKVDALSNKR